MKKYYLTFVICIAFILATIVVGGKWVYTGFLSKMNKPVVLEHAHYDYEPNQNIKPAVAFSVGENKPEMIEGVLGFYSDYNLSSNILSIKVINTHYLEAELVSVHNYSKNLEYSISGNTILPVGGNEPEYKVIEIENVSSDFVDDLGDMYLNYNYGNQTHSVKISPWTINENDVFYSTYNGVTDNTLEFDFISIENNKITLSESEIIIDKPLYIPEGFSVVVDRGTSIDLVNEAYIVSESPIIFNGDEKHPINIGSSDGTGKGLFVYCTESKSVLSNVVFTGLDSPSRGIWKLSGAVTFYEADVDIRQCLFKQNRSEDGLNIIRSTFYIESIEFDTLFKDAIDIDFSEGTINNSRFYNIDKDGINISSSKVSIKDVVLKDVGYNAVIGCDESEIFIENILVNSAIVGLASKDMTRISIKNSTVEDTMVCITLFQDKPEFGPAHIIATAIKLIGDYSIEYLIQDNSKLIVDGEEVIPRSKTKESIIFDKMIAGEPLK